MGEEWSGYCVGLNFTRRDSINSESGGSVARIGVLRGLVECTARRLSVAKEASSIDQEYPFRPSSNGCCAENEEAISY